MTTEYTYTMKFDPSKIADMMEQAFGKEVRVGVSGNRNITFTFIDEDLTQEERVQARDGMPEFVKMFYSFDRSVREVPDEV